MSDLKTKMLYRGSFIGLAIGDTLGMPLEFKETHEFEPITEPEAGEYVWWHKKFAFIIDEISKSTGMSYADARMHLSQKDANKEIVPYHSTSFYDPAGWTKSLESALLAR